MNKFLNGKQCYLAQCRRKFLENDQHRCQMAQGKWSLYILFEQQNRIYLDQVHLIPLYLRISVIKYTFL